MGSSIAASIFERHHLAVFRFLRRSTFDASTAEDLTQEVFLRVVRAVEAYEDRAQERAWVFRIARNVLVDEHRRRTRAPAGLPLDATPLSGAAAVQALRASLNDALGRLRAEEREAFLMREVGGLGYDEIAFATESTRDAARMRIYRARLALKGMLAEAAAPARQVSGGSR